MDGSFSAADNNAGASAVIRSDKREAEYARDKSRCIKLGGKREQFPDGVSGAALSHTFAMDNNDAEAVAVLTALTAIPTGAYVTVHAVSDSKSTEASIKKFIGTTRNRRSVEDMSLRAPMAAIHGVLGGGSKTLTLRFVPGHQPPSASRDAHGNNTADEAADRLRVRKPGPGESPVLHHCDAMAFVPNQCVLNQHIAGSVKEAVKATLRKEAMQETVRRDSSQSITARSFRADSTHSASSAQSSAESSAASGLNGARAAAKDKDEDFRAEAFYAMASDIGRRIRGAQKGRNPLDGAAQRWLTRLASGTLYTLEMIEKKCLQKADSRVDDIGKLVQTVSGMRVVN